MPPSKRVDTGMAAVLSLTVRKGLRQPCDLLARALAHARLHLFHVVTAHVIALSYAAVKLGLRARQ